MTACRLPGSFLDVLPNVRSPTPTQSKVHTGAGEIQDNISCMDYTTSEFLLFPRLTNSWLLPTERLVAAWTACTVQKKKHGGSREHERASHVLHVWSAAWPAGKELKSNQHTHVIHNSNTIETNDHHPRLPDCVEVWWIQPQGRFWASRLVSR